MIIRLASVLACLNLLLPGNMLLASDSLHTAPAGWFLRTSVAEDYHVGTDHNVVHSGKGSGFLWYAVHPMVVHPQRGPAFLAQAFSAAAYKGHRVRVTAYAKTRQVSDGASLWVILEGGPRVLRQSVYLSPMPVKRTSNWSRYTCVLDVPSSMSVMAIGVMLGGRGTIWLDDVRIEVVGKEIPPGGASAGPPWSLKDLGLGHLSAGPENLDFEQ